MNGKMGNFSKIIGERRTGMSMAVNGGAGGENNLRLAVRRKLK